MGTRRYRSEFSPITYLIRLRRALAVALVLCSNALAQPLSLEIIELKHSLVDDILPLIRPLLAPGGTATGMNSQLVVKTTPTNLDEIKRVLANFDRAPRTLKITVRQDVSEHTQTREDALSGRFRSGNVRGRIPDLGPGRGASIGIQDGNNNAIRYRSLNTQSADDSYNTHFVTTLEGRPALIQTGQSIPYPHPSATYDRYGAVFHEGTDYREISSGFYVTPRLHGQQVTLDIAPQLERSNPTNPDNIDTRYASSTVSGRIGEWIPLGGLRQSSTQQDKALVARTRRHGAENYGVWVKVEEIN